MRSRRWSWLIGSAIAAAFLGPGTVATAASAGARHGVDLLWALVFSTAACLVLQEAAARLAIRSGSSLAEALRASTSRRSIHVLMTTWVAGAVVLGCAAYEAGNILGGVAGASLGVDLSPRVLTLLTGAAAAALLAAGGPTTVARALAVLVALMGIAFLATAVVALPSPARLAQGLIRPSVPEGSGLLVLGLLGTTVVPYNLFLGSGLARGLGPSRDVKLGLAVSIGFGGLISMAVLVTGTAVEGEFSFRALSAVLERRLGAPGRLLFAGGLFAAGLSSAVTAPLAAAYTAQGLFFREKPSRPGSAGGAGFRGVWIAVLAVGLAFGLAEVKPIPVILVAQALNGLLLPFVAVFLWLAVNDPGLMGAGALNGRFSNVAMGLTVAISLVLGTSAVARAVASALGLPPPDRADLLAITLVPLVAAAWPVGRALRRRRAG